MDKSLFFAGVIVSTNIAVALSMLTASATVSPATIVIGLIANSLVIIFLSIEKMDLEKTKNND